LISGEFSNALARSRGMKNPDFRRRTISVAQRGQIVQRVIVDHWTSDEAAAFGVRRRLVDVWVADFRRHGMASLREDARRGNDAGCGLAPGAGSILHRSSGISDRRAARPALAAAPVEQGRPAVSALSSEFPSPELYHMDNSTRGNGRIRWRH